MPKETLSSLESVLVLLEDIRSQNRATIEAVQATRAELKRDLQQSEERTNDRFKLLNLAVRQNSTDIRQNSEDIIQINARLDLFERLEDRVTALERRHA